MIETEGGETNLRGGRKEVRKENISVRKERNDGNRRWRDGRTKRTAERDMLKVRGERYKGSA